MLKYTVAVLFMAYAVYAGGDSQENEWPGVEKSYKALDGKVIPAFDREEKPLLGLLNKLWNGPGVFVQGQFCDNVKNLVKARDDISQEEFEQALGYAFILDLGCLKSGFERAEHIPLDAMVSGTYSDQDAIGLIYEVFKQMHFVKEAGRRFNQALVKATGDDDKKDENLVVEDELREEFAIAFIQDLECFREAYEQVNHIPLHAMISGVYSEHEALGLIQDIFEEMHFIKESGKRFHWAVETLSDEIEKDKRVYAEKGELDRLYSLLKRYLSRRK